MHLRSVSLRCSGGSVRLIGEVESERRHGPFELYFEFPAAYADFVSEVADPFVAAMLIPAMFQDEPLAVSPPVSARLAFELPRLRDIFHAWHPATLKRSDIHVASVAAEPKLPANHAATFFSGGVDSFYTLLKHRREHLLPAPLTHVIFMRGIEKPLDFARGVEASQARAEAIATTAGVRCISGESNIRSYFDPDWLHHYCGSALAATALSLAAGLDYVCIPSTYWYSRLRADWEHAADGRAVQQRRGPSRARRRRIAANGEDCEDCRVGSRTGPH